MLLPYAKPPEQWDEGDLQKLCDDTFPETQRLDYKRELKLDSPDEKGELLKDLSSLANSLGGVIIYGIEEKKDSIQGTVAGNLQPMNDQSIIDKANRVVRSNISPKVEFYLYKVNSVKSGFYIIAYVPQSTNRPHAFSNKRRLYYYKRVNQDNFPMDESEIREMYYQSSLSSQSIDKRYENLDLEFGPQVFWRIVITPLVSGLIVLDTLNIIPKDLITPSYVTIIHGSNAIKAQVDRFEEYE